MHIHILGICGTFMGGIARLARELGHTVTGADANVYPPMSEQLAELGIEIHEGYQPAQLRDRPDLVLIGNSLSRGNEAVEYVLENRIPYDSGPAWLAREVLGTRRVIAVTGTHGKTTTSSMLAWFLEHADKNPGFLIGGVPQNFGVSARLGNGDFFVIEGDEYDTAFFDKRSKFVHYHPDILVINNLEYDHADIFDDLAAIQRQFHHLVRTIPRTGKILYRAASRSIDTVLAMGCWTHAESFGEDAIADWTVITANASYSELQITHRDEMQLVFESPLFGRHNALNMLAATAGAHEAGVTMTEIRNAIAGFRNVKRRLELVASSGGIRLYDDFAHHPTAIHETLNALRARIGDARILAVLEARSNTMRRGVHAQQLGAALAAADRVFLLDPAELSWSLKDATAVLADRRSLHSDVTDLAAALTREMRSGDHVIVMTNGDFGGLRETLRQDLESPR